MTKQIGLLTGLGVVLLGFGASVQATPLTGQVSYSGGVVLNADLPVATTYTSFISTLALPTPESTGSFVAANPADANTFLVPFTYTVGALPNEEMWSAIIGGNTFNYYGTSVIKDSFSVSGGLGYVNIGGTGYFIENGDVTTKTPGSWSETLTGQNTDNTPTFGGVFYTTFVNVGVPDGGTTAGLLGMGLAACALFTRKMKLA
jgi:hypothetical protein